MMKLELGQTQHEWRSQSRLARLAQPATQCLCFFCEMRLVAVPAAERSKNLRLIRAQLNGFFVATRRWRGRDLLAGLPRRNECIRCIEQLAQTFHPLRELH